MFAQAGFRQDFETLGSAVVSLGPGTKEVLAYLVRWGDDLAWASRTRVIWADQVLVHAWVKRGTLAPAEAAQVALLHDNVDVG